MRSGAGRENAGDAGFSLLEMLVVLAIVALVGSTTFAAFRGAGERLALDRTAGEIASLARAAGARARATGREERLVWHRAAGRFDAAGRTVALPKGVEVTMTTARGEVAEQMAAIRFLPDGRSTGGEIRLSRDGRLFTLGIDWLTGAATLAETRP